MKEMSPYTADCLFDEKRASGILYPGASSFPGSKVLKYYPLNKMPYELRVDPNCFKAFHIPIVWKSEVHDTPLYRQLSHSICKLPLQEKGSKVVYMKESAGYFFDLRLEDGICVTITQYEDESEKGAYVNVTMDGEILVQDFMSINDIVSAMKEYYDGREN